MPAPREGDETVSIKQQRVTRACEADEVERAEEWDREREVGLQPAEPGNGGQQDDGQREEAHRAVPAPEPVDRDQHAERDKRDRDRVLHEPDEVTHEVTSGRAQCLEQRHVFDE